MMLYYCFVLIIWTIFIHRIQECQSYIFNNHIHYFKRNSINIFEQNNKNIKRINHLSISKQNDLKLFNDLHDTQEDEIEDEALFALWEKEEYERLENENRLLNSNESDSQSLRHNKYSNNEADDTYNEEYEDSENEEQRLPASKLPIIAIVGRPNTGKSTIVNRLSSQFKDGSIVNDEPGITRDRSYTTGSWCEYNFQIVDTGGMVFDDKDDIFADQITHQAQIALQEASVAILVCDGQHGVHNLDLILARWLRKHFHKPLYLAVNKCEAYNGLLMAQEFWELGLGTPYPVSGIHGNGLGEVLDEITQKIPKVTHVLTENCTNVALIGRPNVGKSSLLNRLVGQERSIVSSIAGTTRDAVDALVQRKNQTFRIIDTAGVRKRSKVDFGTEYFMVNRAFKAIKRSDVVVLLIDATEGVVDQDKILAEKIIEEGRACIIALNKWDAVPDKDEKSYQKVVDNIRMVLPSLKWSEIVLMSALTGQRTEQLFYHIHKANEHFHRRISTSILNEILHDSFTMKAPPMVQNRQGRFYYAMQVASAPPTFIFFVNDPKLFPTTYQKYLENEIRNNIGLNYTPIKIFWRGKTVRQIDRAAKKGDLREHFMKITRWEGKKK